MSIDCSFRSLTSPGSNEILSSQNSLTFKLLKTVADFSQALSNLHDKFGHELQVLVENFRKRNGELRKERLQCPSSLFQVWELFLQQVEVNSQQHGDISRNFCQTIGNGLVERIFHRKIQSKKIFAHRDRIETILLKSNELLLKCYSDYCQAYALAITNPAQYMSEYIASHNVYVHQLQATNGMIHAYQTKTLPKLLEELEECHLDTSSIISSSLLESSEFVNQKCQEQAAGYLMIGQTCKQANHKHDLGLFVKVAAQSIAAMAQQQQQQQQHKSDNYDQHQPSDYSKTADDNSAVGSATTGTGNNVIRYHQFQSPNLQNVSLSAGPLDPKNIQIVPTFKNEIAPDLSQPPSQQQPQLEQDKESLEEKIEKFEERIETLLKLLSRSQESRLYNKVNELQEELCQRRFDLQVAQIHLSAVRSQLQLFEYNYRPNQAAISSLLQPDGSGQLQNCVDLTLDGSNIVGGGGGSSLTLLAANHQMGSNYQLNSLAGGLGLAGGGGGGGGGSQLSAGSGGLSRKSSSNLHHNQTAGYRNKWIKAFKSLKEPSTTTSSSSSSSAAAIAAATATGGSGSNASSIASNQTTSATAASAAALLAASGNQKFGDSNELQQQQQHQIQSNSNQQREQREQLENQHFFQEYTFKKIASCDVCKDFLRGHMRQGVKCKLCKISCHNDCQSKAHTTIKCQQPKIKLLRRQKSAGELEVNNLTELDGNEQTTERSSKPDSIYSLIRQVLDAKKRGGHPQQQQQQQQQQQIHPSLLLHANDSRGQLGNSALMLSSGNLSLATQNAGMSVSTSALQAGPSNATNVSVDRWAVVMDLLAQSRKKDKESQLISSVGDNNTAGVISDALGIGGGTSGKRHSKQLDKFKSAAKSAAAASRHQYLQQQQQLPNNSSTIFNHHDQQQQQQQYTSSMQQQSQQQQLGPTSSSPLSHQYPDDYLQQQQQGQPMSQHLLQPQQQQTTSSGSDHQGQQMHLHHTKSLPVGSKQQQLVGQPQLMQPTDQRQIVMQSHNLPHHQPPISSLQHQPQQQLAHLDASNSAPSSSNYQQQQQQPYQLLNISSQQIQSTSAPHSPHRKRFNLRMKSFSLDSPESPSVQPNAAAAAIPSAVNSIGSASSIDPSTINYAIQQQQQQQQAQSQPMIPFDHQQHQQQHQHQQQIVMQHQQQLYQQQQQQQQQQPQQQHIYLNQTSSVGYPTQPQQQQHSYLNVVNYQQQPSRQFEEEAGSAYWRQARQQYNHRHSYHNPPFHYQQHDNSNSSSKQDNNNNNNNSNNSNANVNTDTSNGHRAGLQQQRRDSSAGLELSPASIVSAATAAASAKQQRASSSSAPSGSSSMMQAGGQQINCNNSHNNNNNHGGGGGGDDDDDEDEDDHTANRLILGDNQQNEYYDLNLDVSLRSQADVQVVSSGQSKSQQQQQQQQPQSQSQSQTQQQQQQQPLSPGGTFVALYDYNPQRADEIQLSAGQLVSLVDSAERDWWKVRPLDGTNRLGYFPASYLTKLYQNERPLQVIQTIQVSDGEICDKLLRGQIVMHTGKRMDSFITIRLVAGDSFNHYIQCPEKYLMEIEPV